MSELEITHTDSRFGPQAPNASAELLCEYLKTKLTKQVMLNQFTFPFNELNSTLYFLEREKKSSLNHMFICVLWKLLLNVHSVLLKKWSVVYF